jgi:hypothetical protein
MLLLHLRRSVLVAAAATSLVVGSSAAWAGPGTVASTVAVSGTSPFAGCTADAVADQTGTNYPNTEVEPWIAASTVDRNGDGAADVITGYQQDRWSNGGSRGVAASVLYRGAWLQVTIPGTSACAGGTRYLRASDPWVSFSPNGVLYFFTLGTDVTGVQSAMLVNRSTDGGLTWSPPTVLIDENDPEHFNDKNSLTADPLNSNYAYAIWDRSRFPSDQRYQHSTAGFPRSLRSDAYFSRTTNGGLTWETPHAIYAPKANQFGIGHQIEVVRSGPHAGRLVDVFTLFHGSGSNNKGQELAVLISDDKGATWSAPIRISKMMPGYVSDPDDGEPLRTGDIIPDIAAGPNGDLYVVWQEATLAPSGSAIAFSRSTDGGATWTAPTRINTVPTAQAFNPSIAVLADGTIALIHYDLRFNTPGPATLPTDVWFLHSHNRGTTWTETRVTPTSFDFNRAPVARGLFLGDYMGLAARGAQFVSAYAVTTATDRANITVSLLNP